MLDVSRRGLVLGLLAVALAGLLALGLVYPFAPEERPDHPEYDVPSSNASGYAVLTEVTVEEAGQEVSDVQGVLNARDDAVIEFVDHDGRDRTYETTRYTDVGASWRTARRETHDRALMASWTAAADDEQILQHLDIAVPYRLVTTVENDTSVEGRFRQFLEDIGATPALAYPSYERRGETTRFGRSQIVYEPRGGWYESAPVDGPYDEYRLVDVEGELNVDAETGMLSYAEVSYTVVGAGSGVEYAVERLRDGKVAQVEAYVRVDDEVDFDRPDWAEPPE